MDLPTYSVVIATHSRPTYLFELLKSIEEQTHLPEQVFIVLNGTGQSSEILRQYEQLSERQWKFSSKWIKSPETNISESFNLGVAQVRSEWTASLGDDDLVAPDRFKSQLSLCKKNNAIIGAASANFIDGNGLRFPDDDPTVRYFRVADENMDIFHHMFFDNRVVGSTEVFLTQRLKEVGGMDPELLLTHDFDLTLKLARPGAYCFDPNRLTCYRVHGGGLFAAHRQTALLELAHIINRLEANPDSLLYHLAQTYPGQAENILIESVAYPYKYLAASIALRNGFKGRVQKNPVIPLRGKESQLLKSAQAALKENNSASHISSLLQEVKALTIQAKELKGYISELEKRSEEVQHLLKKRSVQFALALQGTKKRPKDLAKVAVAQVADMLSATLKEDVDRLTLRQPNESLRSAIKKMPNRIGWKRQTSNELKQIANAKWPENIPLISAIVVCGKNQKRLVDCLDSIFSQTWNDFEVLIVEAENGSVNSAVLRMFEKVQFLRFVNDRNIGLGEARLFGLEHARGKYAIFMEPNDTIDPTYFEKAIYLMETKGVDVVTPHTEYIISNSYNAVQISKTVVHHQGIPVPIIFEKNTCSDAALFRLSFWAEHEIGYRVENGDGLEAWDFWLRFSTVGARYAIIPEVLHHRSVKREPETPSLDSTAYKNRLQHRWNSLRLDSDLHFRVIHRQNQDVSVQNAYVNLQRGCSPPRRKELRILLCVPWLDLGGSSMLMSEVFLALKDHGIAATVISTTPHQESDKEGNMLYNRFTSDIFRLDQFLSEERQSDFIKHLIRSRQVDLLLQVGSAATYAAMKEIRTDFPHLKIVDHLYNPIGHIKSNQQYRENIDFNIVANETVRQVLLELGEKDDRIKVVFHGIDTERFNPESIDYGFLGNLRPWKSVPSTFIFGYLGRLSEEKAPEDILELAHRLPNAKFLICGSGPEEQRLKQKWAELGLQDTVHFAGRIKNTMDFYRSVNAVIIPSRIEGLPLVLLEAMAMELPVIGADVGHIGKVIDHGNTGYVYPSGDIRALELFGRKLISLEQDALTQMGKRGRKRVVDEYSLRNCVNQYHETFMALAQNRKEKGQQDVITELPHS